MLKIYFDGELLEFDDDDLIYMYVDDGREGVVYKYGRDAIKIYNEYCLKDRLNEEQCRKLGIISTKRILLPEKIAYGEDCKTFTGYSTPFIYKYPCARIMDMKIDKFCDELDLISDDLKILADNDVEVDDLHTDNILYNGKLYIGDPGSFIFRSDHRPQQAMGNNIFTLNRFIKDEVFLLAKLTKKAKRNLEVVFDDSEYIGWQIRDTMEKRETVKQYVKRMTK